MVNVCSISSDKSSSVSFNLHGCYIYSLKNCHIDSHILLGMSELDLQQIATDLGQQKYRGKQLHQLLYKCKVLEIQDFNHCKYLLPTVQRNDLQEAGWKKVGRSPLHQFIKAADGTIKAPGHTQPPDTCLTLPCMSHLGYALLNYCKDYFDETSCKVSFVYVLLAGVNDAREGS
ncbi:hypothetical protein MKW98_008550 [Papaver atlanticum]|uniref:Uncharacterized protein n=1 Tax=Papaver atlanticum TaxID=357466 RepID=A0AAD4TCW1_9MAGN|nr:hypothetical protein MKW98_008550 [Papaver atlanticum]